MGIASSYDIFLNIIPENGENLDTLVIINETDGGNTYLDSDTHYFQLGNNKRYFIMKNFFTSKKIKLEFLIKTKTSQTLVLTKSYDFTLTSTTTSWTGGTIIEGNTEIENNYNSSSDMNIQEEQNNSNSSNSGNIVVPGIDNSGDITFEDVTTYDFNDILKMCESGFKTFKILFSLLPDFVWGLVVTFILICIVLRVIGK